MLDFLQAATNHIKGTIGPEEKKRALVCATCPEKEKRNYADFLDSKIVEINGYVCLKCEGPVKCPLATKIFARDEKNICPKWK